MCSFLNIRLQNLSCYENKKIIEAVEPYQIKPHVAKD